MAQLISEQFGSGEKVVLLHGWGMNHKIWPREVLAAVPCQWILVDLPGHGNSASVPLGNTLDKVIEQLEPLATEPATWVGWSLGGLFALAMADAFPTRVRRLGLVSSTPRFVQSENWPFAIEKASLQNFYHSLQHDYRQTLKRFIALQFINTPNSRQNLLALQKTLVEQQPDPRSLLQGLDFLQTLDLRPAAARLTQPVHLFLGKQDRLVPFAARKAIKSCFPAAQFTTISADQAGHAPFVSHPQLFQQFLQQLVL